MSRFNFYGHGIPGVNLDSLAGRLIVLEGPDSVGRTTQTVMLSNWLESKGHAVLVTGLTRSELTSEGLEQAKSGHTLGRKTMSLFYATDFADQLENQIIPLYYNRDVNEIPTKWVSLMKESIKSLTYKYSTHRMVQEYTDKMYVPSMERYKK